MYKYGECAQDRMGAVSHVQSTATGLRRGKDSEGCGTSHTRVIGCPLPFINGGHVYIKYTGMPMRDNP